MSDDDLTTDGPGRRTVLLVAVSATAVLVGWGLDLLTPQRALDATSRSAHTLAASAAERHPEVVESAHDLSEAAVEGWSDLLVHGGAGFLVAFAAGYCLRSFLKVLLTVLGSATLILVTLGALGMIEPDYERLFDTLRDALAALPDELESFSEFASGRTSMLVAGLLGLLAGWMHD